MKLMLTSFGIEQAMDSPSDSDSLFYRMPPVAFQPVRESFLPDYELLVLCESVVMDEQSYYRLVDGRFRAFSVVAETFKALKEEGRVQLVDYSSILQANSDLLQRMMEHDMNILDQWVIPLRESLGLWEGFARVTRDIWEEIRYPSHHIDAPPREMDEAQSRIAHGIHYMAGALHHAKYRLHSVLMVEEALQSSEKRKHKEYRNALREVLEPYLSYVNANLVLSNELDIGFHDWLDFTPFYTTKFLSVGKCEEPTWQHRGQVERLFTIAFPDLAIRDTVSLLKVINDKRIEDLRRLISDAVAGKAEFDDRWARSVLMEVLHTEWRTAHFRKVLGYVTLPIGLVPWVGTPAQKVIEEAIGTAWEKKLKREHQWFYMLSEIADSRQGADNTHD